MSTDVLGGLNGGAHLYLGGSCLRMSRTVEMAYSPVSSVSTSSSPAPLPPEETAENTCGPYHVQALGTAC